MVTEEVVMPVTVVATLGTLGRGRGRSISTAIHNVIHQINFSFVTWSHGIHSFKRELEKYQKRKQHIFTTKSPSPKNYHNNKFWDTNQLK